MISDNDLVTEINTNLSEYYTVTWRQRQELFRSYQYRDCMQWDSERYNERKRLDKAITVINMAAPIVRAVAGADLMQAKKLEYVAMDPQFDAESDIMGDGIDYAQHVSGYESERSIAAEDACTCGIGGTVTYLDMSFKDAIAGRPVMERIFPGFMGFDNSARGSRMNEKMRWCFYADPVNSRNLDDYIAEAQGNKKSLPEGAGDYKGFLMSFSQQQNIAYIDFLYSYFWWEYETIYDVKNPFAPGQVDAQLAQRITQDPAATNIIGEVCQKIKIDWEASFWSLDKESFTALTNAIEAIGLLLQFEPPELESSQRKGKCYYRAEFARGLLLRKSRSYTQHGHALNIMTGYFDETTGEYYGLMRPLSYVQDCLNEAVSDMRDYTHSSSHGGNAYIAGASESIERIKKEKAYQDALTPVPAGAVITAKSLPTTGQSLVSFIQFLTDVMPRVLGLGPEFMGIISSGTMTDSLYGKVMKQSFAVLSNFTNNAAIYDRRQGEIFIDIIRLMAEANDGMVLPILSPGKEGDQYMRLLKQNLATEYAIRIIEKPMSKDEKQDSFNIISQMFDKMPQNVQAGVLPELLKLSNLDHETKDAMVKAATPQPQQPDPVNQALLTSQTAYQNAQAQKLTAEAQETMEQLPKLIAKLESEATKNNAQAMVFIEESKPDSVPLLKKMQLDMDHEFRMAQLASDERANAAKTEASGKPAINMSVNGMEGILSPIAERLGHAAQAMSDMAGHTMKTNNESLTAHHTSANALMHAAKILAAPKHTKVVRDKKTNAATDFIQTPIMDQPGA